MAEKPKKVGSPWKTFFKVIFWMIGLGLAAVIGLIIFMVTTMESYGKTMPFKEAHQRAVRTFVDSKGFGIARIRQKGYWLHGKIIFEDVKYDTFHRRESGPFLIGLSPEYGPRYFDTRYPPSKKKITSSEYRSLTEDEHAAIAKLRAGKAYAKITSPEHRRIRVLAPLLASENCLACHEVQEGELLGAFAYDFFFPEEDKR